MEDPAGQNAHSLQYYRRPTEHRCRTQRLYRQVWLGYAALPKGTGCVQWAQRLASMGISLRHSGHFFVVGSAGASALRIRATKTLTGVTTKKYTAAATSTKEMAALMKSPMANTLPLMVNLMAEKSGFPTIAAITGVSRSFVKADTTEANAAPMTTPTAISITLPRRMNCLNPLSMTVLLEVATTLQRAYRSDKRLPNPAQILIGITM